MQPGHRDVKPGHSAEPYQRFDSGEHRRGRGQLPEITNTLRFDASGTQPLDIRDGRCRVDEQKYAFAHLSSCVCTRRLRRHRRRTWTACLHWRGVPRYSAVERTLRVSRGSLLNSCLLQDYAGQGCGSSLLTSTSIGNRRLFARAMRRPDAVPRRGFFTRDCTSRTGRCCGALLCILASFSFLDPRTLHGRMVA